jgi:lipopolysaccharide transport system permease protein
MGADKMYLLNLNPFVALMAVIRKPILGELPTSQEWAVATLVAVGGFFVTLPLIGYCRRRIVYWI